MLLIGFHDILIMVNHMDMLSMTIEGKQYEYIDSILYEGKNYVAFCDEECISICEYVMEENKVKLFPLDEALFAKVKDAMHL